MNKVDFLKELEKRLRYLPKEDREDAVRYYSEYMADMGVGDEEDVISKIGKPKDIAMAIITECAEKRLEENKSDREVKRSTQIIWLLLILVFSLPITIPVAFVFFCILFVLFVCGISFGMAAVVSLFSTFVVGGLAQKAVCFGFALIALSIAILICLGVFVLGELFVKLMIAIVKKLSIKEKKEV